MEYWSGGGVGKEIKRGNKFAQKCTELGKVQTMIWLKKKKKEKKCVPYLEKGI